MHEQQKTLTIQEIFDFLPHRYPFLLVDRVLDYQVGDSLLALKNVTMNEPFFTGHFPGNPVMPGVLIVESMAQAGAILAYASEGFDPKEYLFYLASVDNVKFKKMVIPGDQLELSITFAGKKRNFWKIEGVARVNGEVVCSADLLCAAKKG